MFCGADDGNHLNDVIRPDIYRRDGERNSEKEYCKGGFSCESVVAK